MVKMQEKMNQQLTQNIQMLTAKRASTNLELVLSLEVELWTVVIMNMKRKNLKLHGSEILLRKFLFLILRNKKKCLWNKSEVLWMLELWPLMHNQTLIRKVNAMCHLLWNRIKLRCVISFDTKPSFDTGSRSNTRPSSPNQVGI